MKQHKNLIFLLVLAAPVVLSANECSKKSKQSTNRSSSVGLHTTSSQVNTQPDIPLNQIMGITWIHAHEAKAPAGVEVYVSQEEQLPPSRFRHRFRIEEDGTFYWYELAPNDAHYMAKGRWKPLSAERISVNIGEKTWYMALKKIEPGRIEIVREQP